MSKNLENKTDASVDRINFFLQILQMQMGTCNIAIGWDEKQKKLILVDVETRNIARIDLSELNDKAIGTHLF